MADTLLIAFLLVNVFAVGALTVLGVQYLRAHRKNTHPQPVPTASDTSTLPEDIRQRLVEAAVLDFQNMLTRTGRTLHRDQAELVDDLNRRLDSMGNKIVDDEMKRYRSKIDELRKKAETSLSSATAETATHQNQIEAELEKHRAELEAKLRADATAAREKLKAQLDVKLSDAVVAFLIETMGHNIDIGAQHNYLLSQLEEHKQELIGGITEDDTTRGQT